MEDMMLDGAKIVRTLLTKPNWIGFELCFVKPYPVNSMDCRKSSGHAGIHKVYKMGKELKQTPYPLLRGNKPLITNFVNLKSTRCRTAR